MSHLSRSLALALAAAVCALGCADPKPPPAYQVVELHGSPYERGLQHGQALRSDIRAFYTELLTASLLPYLNREQPGIAAFLPTYQGETYANGQFSYQLLLDSALRMQKSISLEHQQELRGIADGSGLTYEQVLVLNTFPDTTLAVRAVALALHLSSAPHVESLEFVGAASDGVDNDGDGVIDNPGEGLISPYAASPTAAAVELPTDVQIRWVIADDAGVDPASLRIELDDRAFTTADPQVQVESLDDHDGRLQVTFSPPDLQPATIRSVTLYAADKVLVTDPPPEHERFMREERLTFTTRGAGKLPYQVPNRGVDDGRSRPTSLAFAARGAETAGGAPLLAQHFALLDANSSHKHSAIFIHHPESGPTFAVVGWAGIAWGFSGLNSNGASYACNPSDTLDNAVVGNLIGSIADLSKAKLLMAGTPIGFAGREILEGSANSADAVAALQQAKPGFGWNCLLADASGDLRAAEIDDNVDGQPGGGVHVYGGSPDDPANRDRHGQMYASLGPDDLFVTSHFLKNSDDIFTVTVQGQRVVPQAQWSSFYFRSLRTRANLADALAPTLGTLDVNAAIGILRRDELVDHSDSMNAVVIEPAKRTLHVAIGTEPATDAEFQAVEVKP